MVNNVNIMIYEEIKKKAFRFKEFHNKCTYFYRYENKKVFQMYNFNKKLPFYNVPITFCQGLSIWKTG